MGSYNVIDSVSNLHITDGDRMVLLYVNSPYNADSMDTMYYHDVWEAMSLPVRGEYNDCGSIEIRDTYSVNARLLHNCIKPFMNGDSIYKVIKDFDKEANEEYYEDGLSSAHEDVNHAGAIYIHEDIYDSIVMMGRSSGNGFNVDCTEELINVVDSEKNTLKEMIVNNKRLAEHFPDEPCFIKDTFVDPVYDGFCKLGDPSGYAMHNLRGMECMTSGRRFNQHLTHIIRLLITSNWMNEKDNREIVESFSEYYHFLLGMRQISKKLFPAAQGTSYQYEDQSKDMLTYLNLCTKIQTDKNKTHEASQ